MVSTDAVSELCTCVGPHVLRDTVPHAIRPLFGWFVDRGETLAHSEVRESTTTVASPSPGGGNPARHQWMRNERGFAAHFNFVTTPAHGITRPATRLCSRVQPDPHLRAAADSELESKPGARHRTTTVTRRRPCHVAQGRSIGGRDD